MECGDLREAEKLVANALLGDPPTEIAEELRDLLEQVYFERHLETRGTALLPEEIRLSMAGKAVGLGVAMVEPVVSRIHAMERIIHRTAERKLGHAYREHGPPPKAVRESYEVFVSVPKAASFAVSFRVGRPQQTRTFPGWFEEHTASSIVDSVVNGIEQINAGHYEELKTLIPDEAYYRNFVGLVKQLAPTGSGITTVGLTIVREKKTTGIELGRTRAEIAMPSLNGQPGRERVRVEGILRFADKAEGESGRIKIRDDKDHNHTIVVPEGMMNDIVRPLWDRKVIVDGYREKTVIYLEDVSGADE